jgi:hypothetical protein
MTCRGLSPPVPTRPRSSPRLALGRSGAKVVRPVPNDDMWFSDLLSLPWGEARTKANAIENPTKADPALVGFSRVSNPRLGHRPSTSPTSGPLTSYDHGSSGMRIVSFRTPPLTVIPCNIDSNGWVEYLFSKIRGRRTVKISLESVAGGLSAILNDCDVRQSLLYHTSCDTYGCPSKLWRVAKR